MATKRAGTSCRRWVCNDTLNLALHQRSQRALVAFDTDNSRAGERELRNQFRDARFGPDVTCLMVVELSSCRAMQVECGKNEAGSVQRFSSRRNWGPQSTAAAFRAVACAEWAGMDM